MLIVNNELQNGVLALRVTDKLTEGDLNDLVPVLKNQVDRTEDPHLIMIMEDFKGWDDAATFWKDLRLDAEYIGSFDRIAIVGEEKWQQWSTQLLNPLFNEELQFFSLDHAGSAWNWIRKSHEGTDE
ncbi:STAS/SEC14 domain-containing protein [Fodinibius salsisoli]|jgi:hypothetical protein|uniref:STAS/SEC14 domain-containing protein n=1 Tax=Fodinibius salsisoli TaxID=2820877 RepID=A0ABT3PK15_9BACT|nr:STAS/SEC14 domain-containing protein [Fodinibius salsisoli]MCW9706259.1 STAS/SEC14 domain-containing protein [Fodinibius salsisoli]